MSRPRSVERRAAILSAATGVFASQGVGAATAVIAARAGVSNGSLFGYFPTKPDLINELYAELKSEMVNAVMHQIPVGATARDQLSRAWDRWLGWATTYSDKWAALGQLDVCTHITATTRQEVAASFGAITRLLEQARAGGPVGDVPLPFVLALTNAIAQTTIAAITADPAAARACHRVGFDALWRVLADTPEPLTT